MFSKITQTDNAASASVIRLMVGLVFLSEGIQKFLFPDALGIGRFVKIGIPYPEFTAPFVGVLEVVGGLFIIIGLLTRLAAIALAINISVAIISTKIPMLADKGFWAMAHEARADFCMLLGNIFLIIKGGGAWSIDLKIFHRFKRANHSNL
jgi:putative oxidoreductase